MNIKNRLRKIETARSVLPCECFHHWIDRRISEVYDGRQATQRRLNVVKCCQQCRQRIADFTAKIEKVYGEVG